MAASWVWLFALAPLLFYPPDTTVVVEMQVRYNSDAGETPTNCQVIIPVDGVQGGATLALTDADFTDVGSSDIVACSDAGAVYLCQCPHVSTRGSIAPDVVTTFYVQLHTDVEVRGAINPEVAVLGGLASSTAVEVPLAVVDELSVDNLWTGVGCSGASLLYSFDSPSAYEQFVTTPCGINLIGTLGDVSTVDARDASRTRDGALGGDAFNAVALLSPPAAPDRDGMVFLGEDDALLVDHTSTIAVEAWVRAHPNRTSDFPLGVGGMPTAVAKWGDMDESSSCRWTHADMRVAHPLATRFSAAISDHASHMYMLPYVAELGGDRGNTGALLARLDVHKSPRDAHAWDVVEPAALLSDASLHNWRGGCFDGTHVYMVQDRGRPTTLLFDDDFEGDLSAWCGPGVACPAVTDGSLVACPAPREGTCLTFSAVADTAQVVTPLLTSPTGLYRITFDYVGVGGGGSTPGEYGGEVGYYTTDTDQTFWCASTMEGEPAPSPCIAYVVDELERLPLIDDGEWRTYAFDVDTSGVSLGAMLRDWDGGGSFTPGVPLDVYFDNVQVHALGSPHVLRVDTTLSVWDSASWDVAEHDASFAAVVSAYTDCAYDGDRFVYFAAATDDSSVLRYDTQSNADFTTIGSNAWAVRDHFALTHGGPVHSDGRWMYFAPSHSALYMTRLDTAQPGFFHSDPSVVSAAIHNVDMLTVPGIAAQHDYPAAAFDGRYMYWAPSRKDGASMNNVVRYDTAGTTAADFSNAAFWDSYDHGSPDSYYGMVFDGRYIHLGLTTYDTTAPTGFAHVDSWSLPSPTDDGLDEPPLLVAGGFDGRHVFWLPDGTSDDAHYASMLRYDTLQSEPAYALLVSASEGGSVLGPSFVLNSNRGVLRVTAPTRVSDTSWHHLAGTYDGNTLQLFVDGKLSRALDVQATLHDSDATDVVVGRLSPGAGGFVDMVVDEVRMAKVPRTSFHFLLSVTDRTDTTVTVDWETPVFHGSTAVVAYHVYVTNLDTGAPLLPIDVGSAVRSETVSGLATNENAYSFVVEAETANGETYATNTVYTFKFNELPVFIPTSPECTVTGAVVMLTFNTDTACSPLVLDECTFRNAVLGSTSATEDIDPVPTYDGIEGSGTTNGMHFFGEQMLTIGNIDVSGNTVGAEAWVRGSLAQRLEQTIAAKWTLHDEVSQHWTTHDLAHLGLAAGATGWQHSVHDTERVYWLPGAGHGHLLVYDLLDDYALDASVVDIDLQALLAADWTDLVGGPFDGRYLYVFQHGTTTVGTRTKAFLIDTTADLTTTAAYSNVDLVSLMGAFGNFVSCAYDGSRYVYALVARSGTLLRYDTEGTFASLASWSAFSLNPSLALSADDLKLGDLVLDGRYLYAVPTVTGVVVRYDTHADFASSSSYTSFDATSVGDGDCAGYSSAVFDGTSLFFVPYWDASQARTHRNFLRFDVFVPFDSPTAWTCWAGDTIPGISGLSFAHGVYTGRHIVMSAGTNDASGTHEKLLFFDSQLPMDSTSSYTIRDVLSDASVPVPGAPLFDGRFVHFAPAANTAAPALGRWDTASSTEASFRLRASGTLTGSSATPTGPQFTVNLGVNGGTALTLSSQTRWADEEWHHVAGLYDGNTMSLYVDGTLEAQRSIASTVLTSATTDLVIGRVSADGGEGLRAVMDVFQFSDSRVNAGSRCAGGQEDGSGNCVCPTGFVGPTCASLCPGGFNPCNGNGECLYDPVDDEAYCDCDSGYVNAACDDCSPGHFGLACELCDCNQGNCLADDGISGSGLCVCNVGYFGAQCNQLCPGGGSCSGHGSCDDGRDGTGLCACDAKWNGNLECSDCTDGFYDATCSTPCDCTGSPCVDGIAGDGACLCNENFFGAKCASACDCSGHGSCDDGVGGSGACTCDAAFDGVRCELCKTGFWGEDCNECPGKAGATVCSGHGLCNDTIVGTGVCTCDEGFYLGACNVTCQCLHGSCTDSPACAACEAGYFGPDCTDCPLCANGVCDEGIDGSGTCDCDAGWSGPLCDLCGPGSGLYGPTCTPCPDCGAGLCNDGLLGDGRCTCDPGWWSPDCNKLCDGGGNCNARGVCADGRNGDGTCTCFDEFQGAADCSDCTDNHWGVTCVECDPCNNGTCNDKLLGDGSCTCFSGYWGARCENQCPGDGNCNGRGTCTDGAGGTGVCTCDTGFAGSACELCDDGFFGATCQPCPACVHGSCLDGKAGAGTCLCESNWNGGDPLCTTCTPGFFGATCAACPLCDHGQCDDGDLGTGFCTCEPGWAGTTCATQCPGSGVCNNRGVCLDGRLGSGECDCDEGKTGSECLSCLPGYYGATCLKCPDCVAGQCHDGLAGTGVCVCDDGYFSPLCDQLCPGGGVCSGHGTCEDGAGGSGVCTCETLWNGDAGCSECIDNFFGSECTLCPDCGSGVCNDGVNGTGSCFCFDGFYGVACENLCPGNGNCNGRGTCDDGQLGSGVCTCEVGFAGDACEVCDTNYFGPDCTACSACSGHGLCLDGKEGSGECDCFDGFYTSECALQCPGGGNCGGHGVCDDGRDGTGVCTCEPNWMGDASCTECSDLFFGPACDACPNCHSGTCMDMKAGDGTCSCDATFFGPLCDSRCPGGGICFGKGVCEDGSTGSGECTCQVGATGFDCRECEDDFWGLDCDVCPPCVSGTCNDGLIGSGLCDCINAGWEGDLCERCSPGFFGPDCTACPGVGSPCSGHGVCNDTLTGTGLCTCEPGYYGLDCSSPCMCEHGTCNDGANGDGSCDCEDRFAGPLCMQCDPLHYGIDCTQCPFCRNNGTCVEGRQGSGECVCRSAWVGDVCEFCAPGYVGALCVPCIGGEGTPCSNNGECDDGLFGSGTCTCNDGFFAEDCSGVCDCGNGLCNEGSEGDGQCSCRPNFDGPNCDLCEPGRFGPECLRCESTFCSGRGHCDEGIDGTGLCICDVAGWSPPLCDTCDEKYFGPDCLPCPACAPFGGVCNDTQAGTGECICNPLWHGILCDQCEVGSGFYGRGCHACRCSEHGLCNDGPNGDGLCLLCTTPGFTGPQCDVCEDGLWGADCQPCVDCGIHGTCNSTVAGDGSCMCEDGWGGALCDECAIDFVMVLGQCIPSRCEEGTVGFGCTNCAPGFYSPLCVPCPECNNGECNDGRNGDGNCTCHEGWAGDRCTVCDAGYFGAECAPCLGGAGTPCNLHGNCSETLLGDGTCTCEAQFYGEDCGGECDCLHGTCNDGAAGDGACTCEPLWYNPSCSHLCVCNFGVCNDGADGDGSCECLPGYWGDTREQYCQFECAGGADLPCSGNGTCSDGVTGDGTCECLPDHYGPDCSGTCLCVHGTCVDGADGDGTCVCDAFHWGELCTVVRPRLDEMFPARGYNYAGTVLTLVGEHLLEGDGAWAGHVHPVVSIDNVTCTVDFSMEPFAASNVTEAVADAIAPLLAASPADAPGVLMCTLGEDLGNTMLALERKFNRTVALNRGTVPSVRNRLWEWLIPEVTMLEPEQISSVVTETSVVLSFAALLVDNPAEEVLAYVVEMQRQLPADGTVVVRRLRSLFAAHARQDVVWDVVYEGSNRTITLTGLETETAYTLRIKTRNRGGDGPYTEFSFSTLVVQRNPRELPLDLILGLCIPFGFIFLVVAFIWGRRKVHGCITRRRMRIIDKHRLKRVAASMPKKKKVIMRKDFIDHGRKPERKVEVKKEPDLTAEERSLLDRRQPLATFVGELPPRATFEEALFWYMCAAWRLNPEHHGQGARVLDWRKLYEGAVTRHGTKFAKWWTWLSKEGHHATVFRGVTPFKPQPTKYNWRGIPERESKLLFYWMSEAMRFSPFAWDPKRTGAGKAIRWNWRELYISATRRLGLRMEEWLTYLHTQVLVRGGVSESELIDLDDDDGVSLASSVSFKEESFAHLGTEVRGTKGKVKTYTVDELREIAKLHGLDENTGVPRKEKRRLAKEKERAALEKKRAALRSVVAATPREQAKRVNVRVEQDRALWMSEQNTARERGWLKTLEETAQRAEELAAKRKKAVSLGLDPDDVAPPPGYVLHREDLDTRDSGGGEGGEGGSGKGKKKGKKGKKGRRRLNLGSKRRGYSLGAVEREDRVDHSMKLEEYDPDLSGGLATGMSSFDDTATAAGRGSAARPGDDAVALDATTVPRRRRPWEDLPAAEEEWEEWEEEDLGEYSLARKDMEDLRARSLLRESSMRYGELGASVARRHAEQAAEEARLPAWMRSRKAARASKRSAQHEHEVDRGRGEDEWAREGTRSALSSWQEEDTGVTASSSWRQDWRQPASGKAWDDGDGGGDQGAGDGAYRGEWRDYGEDGWQDEWQEEGREGAAPSWDARRDW